MPDTELGNIIKAAKWMEEGHTVRRENDSKWPVLRMSKNGQVVSGIGGGAIILDIEDFSAEDYAIFKRGG